MPRPQPHHPHIGKAPAPAPGTAQETAPAPAPAATEGAAPQKPLPLHNEVTGENYPAVERERARRQHRIDLAVHTMPAHLPSSKSTVGTLVFVSLRAFEGGMRVGLGRVGKLGGG